MLSRSVILLAACFSISLAHSYMTLPLQEVAGYCGVDTTTRPANAQTQCRGPCPEPNQGVPANPEVGGQGPGKAKPVGFADQYQRGQTVETQWLKNNHANGIVRFSLVPLSKRMNRNAHDKFAFFYSCYDANRSHNCATTPSDYCGTGKYKYSQSITIPKYVPDGEYVLAWSWFGGEVFSDMWSCSKVLIKGGPKEASGVPVFYATKSFGSPGAGKCWSRVSRHGVCTDHCTNAISTQGPKVPVGFSNGMTPSPITEADYLAAM